jgi:hypothetical protein
MANGMSEKSMKSHMSGGNGKMPTRRGDPEREKKVKSVTSASGMMSYNVTPKKGKGEI